MKKTLIATAFLAALPALAAAQGFGIQRPARRNAPPRPAQQVESRFDGVFYKAYYLENEEKKVDEAMKLYREYLDKVGPRARLARVALRRLSALLEKKGDKEGLRELQARFGRRGPRAVRPGRQGGRMRMGGARQKPLSREEWIKRRTEMIGRFEERIKQMKESGRGEQFVGRMEQMLVRMKKELEAVKKGAPIPQGGRMMMGRRGGAQGRAQGRRRGLFGAQFAKMPPDERDKAFTALIERLVSFQERMKERGREDAAKRMKALTDKLEALAAKGKWEEVDKTLREGFRRRR